MGEDIRLTDGSILNVKINFLTVYLLQKRNIEKLLKKAEKNDRFSIDVAANIIYCIIRSAGREVSFDEALVLVPPDTDVMKNLVENFRKEFEKYKKKQVHKMNVK